MKKIILAASAAALLLSLIPAAAWSPAGDRIMTRWGKEVTPDNVWQSYPRPQLRREQWKNLNGLWNYSVTAQDAALSSVAFDGEILVPFAIESSLSGVGRAFQPTDKLWYRTTFSLDRSWKGKNIILHFGAVDYRCEVFVNGKSAGRHVGGNNSFSFDITRFVKTSSENTLVVAVTDPTNTEADTRGKQTLEPRGIWYTAVSGIWKTVWLEPVSPTSIVKVVPQGDIATGRVSFAFDLRGAKGGETVAIEVLDGGKVIASYEGKPDDAAVTVPDPVLWSPDCPKLYDFNVTLRRGSAVLDNASSYFALRQVSVVKDEMGNSRFALNGKALFQFGPLDQGWWPDGLLTPPSEEAMLYDMQVLKESGCNTIRKHIKVEPELYYYYADSLGLMMWQDMPAGFETAKAKEQHVGSSYPEDWDAPAEHEAQWKYEFAEMLDRLSFFPSITTWVVFNEGWGQFRTPQITEWVRSINCSDRLINSVTGWADRGVGDMYDVHNYPSTAMKLVNETGGRISVLGEFGGLSLRVDGHLWNPENGWVPYRSTSENLDLMNSYTRLMYDLEALVAQGLSGAIYTQTTDVEIELNGYMTYDREVQKMSPAILNILHSRLYAVKPAVYQTVIPRHLFPCVEKIAPASTAVFEEDFPYDGKSEHLSIWMSSPTTVTVYVNGVKVLATPVRQTRSYNHFNISNAIGLLHEGSNDIRFEIENRNPKAPASFDYSLTSY